MRAALSFLTVLPVGRAPVLIDRGTLLAFPLVGMIVGLCWWLTAVVGLWAWQPLVAATLVLAVDVLVSGGLHVDGVADVADAVASGRDRESVGEVLADPRVGGIGAAALITTFLLRLATISLLVTIREPALLVVVPIVGRAGMVVALAAMPRTEGSLASDFVAHARGPIAGAVTLVSVALASTIGAVGAGAVRASVASVAGLAAAALMAVWWRHRYGFASGDGVGTSGVAAETVTLLTLAVG